MPDSDLDEICAPNVLRCDHRPQQIDGFVLCFCPDGSKIELLHHYF